MDKLKLAHEMAMELVKIKPELAAWQIADRCFEYADAMQAEAEKRSKAEAEQKRKEMREMLNAQNTFVEREGQHFDDVNWQPDWSQAPEWAKWWAMDKDGEYYFFENNPEMKSVAWMPIDAAEVSRAPSFGYAGNWKESLRKRPQ